MRLRNIKRAREVVSCSDKILKEKQEVFEFVNHPGKTFIEIGMGKGSFITGCALAYPQNRYIGIERYASVILRAVERIEEQKENGILFPNLRLLCLDARFLPEYMEDKSIDGIYLNFSDPWPKNRQAHRRLSSDGFLKLYKRLLKPGGFIEQKTDNTEFFDYSVRQYVHHGFQIDEMTYNLYGNEELLKDNIATEYETKFHRLGNKINKIRVIGSE